MLKDIEDIKIKQEVETNRQNSFLENLEERFNDSFSVMGEKIKEVDSILKLKDWIIEAIDETNLKLTQSIQSVRLQTESSIKTKIIENNNKYIDVHLNQLNDSISTKEMVIYSPY